MEFQENLSMLLSIVLSLAVYLTYVSHRVTQRLLIKNCVFISGVTWSKPRQVRFKYFSAHT